jgi:hypothetical protein
MEKEKVEIPIYKLIEVTTQTAPAIQTPKGELISVEEAMVDILNKLDKLIDKM